MVICDKTGTACQHGNDCLLRGVCRLIPNNGLGNLIASQPYSTNQAPAAPSLEQLEKDAARYRWLREQDIDIYFNGSGDSLCGGNLGFVLDNHIDAASHE